MVTFVIAVLGYAVLLFMPPVVAQHALLARMRAFGLRASLGSMLLFALPSAIGSAVIGLAIGFFTAGIVAFFVVTAAAVWYVSRKLSLVDLLVLRRLEKMAERGERAEATALAVRLVTSTNRLESATWMTFGLAAAQAISSFDVADAEKIASTLDDAALTGRASWILAHTLAIYRIMLGRYEDARAILEARAGDPPTPALGAQRDLLMARIDASDGHGDRALERAEGHEDSDWNSIRAHAHAALGQADEARAALEKVREDKGAAALEEIAKRKGPAATIAAAMTASGAYG